jgi:hemolysin III
MKLNAKVLFKTTVSEFSPDQEKLHANIHWFGIIFGIIAIPSIILAAMDIDTYSFIGITFYGICFLLVFIFSTLYHSCEDSEKKICFQKLDRMSIYLLIAGTYTPVVMIYLNHDLGRFLLLMVWFLALIGIIFEIINPNHYTTISIFFYLFMGLLYMFIPLPFFESMPSNISILIKTGVVLYVVGVVFYIWKRWKYHHAMWHVFVLTASIIHYFAIFNSI